MHNNNSIIAPFSNDYNHAVTFWGKDNCVCFAGKLGGRSPKLRSDRNQVHLFDRHKVV